MKLSVMKNKVVELIYESSQYYSDPYNEVQFGINVINPDGNTKRIPGFWGGDNIWRVRYSSSKKGKYKFKTVCSDKTNKDLEGRTGEITVIPYEGKNPLYKHGPLKVSNNKKYLEHEDGSHFSGWQIAGTSHCQQGTNGQKLSKSLHRIGLKKVIMSLY